MQGVIQCPDRQCIRVVNGGVGDIAVPEGIVDGDDPALADQLEALFVLGLIIVFVRIDEGKVKTVGIAVVDQFLQGFVGRRQQQLDFFVYPGLLPVTSGHVGPFLVDIAGNQAPVAGQSFRHAQGAVAGEDADLDNLSGTEQFNQQIQQLPLLRLDLHAGHFQGGGLLTQLF